MWLSRKNLMKAYSLFWKYVQADLFQKYMFEILNGETDKQKQIGRIMCLKPEDIPHSKPV